MTRLLLAERSEYGLPGRDRGTGTVLPATDLRRGDVYFHTGLACLMVYTGTAWRQVHVAEVANAAARTAISTTYAAALHLGFRARLTDTAETWEWDGDSWESEHEAPAITAAPTASNGFTIPAIAGWAPARVWRRHRQVGLKGLMQSTNALSVNTLFTVGTLPAGFGGPLSNEKFPISCYTGTVDATALAIITPAGAIQVIPTTAINAGGTISLGGTWWPGQ